MSRETAQDRMLVEKWADVLKDTSAGRITNSYTARVIARLLENQSMENVRQSEILRENVGPANVTGNVAKWNPILLSLVRRAYPNLIGFDVAGVQAMSGPTGQIFAMYPEYVTKTAGVVNPANQWEAAFFDEPNTAWSGTGTHGARAESRIGEVLTAGDFIVGEVYEIVTTGTTDFTAIGASSNAPNTTFTATGAGSGDGTALVVLDADFATGVGFEVGDGETLNGSGGPMGEMGLQIRDLLVAAKTRKLRATYSQEQAHDMRVQHGLDAEAEFSDILATEILAEINSEFIRTINGKAKLGARNTATPGVYNMLTDANGRNDVDKFKSFIFQIGREGNAIQRESRRGRGNWIIVSPDVGDALAATNMLSNEPQMGDTLDVDPGGNLYAGTLSSGKMKVFIDPYATTDYATVGYRGAHPYDAGLFYCPYVPLTKYATIESESGQPRVMFSTRYGMVANPAAEGKEHLSTPLGENRRNTFFRQFRVTNLGSVATANL